MSAPGTRIPRPPHPHALTLVELVTTLAISSLLLLGLTNAMFIATKAIPPKDDPTASSVTASQVLDQIAAELETAIYVSSVTSKSIAFTVADRDANNVPERIAYSWSGVVNEPLQRTYNGTTWSVIDKVTTFSVVPNVRHITEDFTAPGVDDVAATQLQDLSTLLNANNDKFSGSNSKNFGQYFLPSFGSDVIAWRPTNVSVMMSQDRIPGTFRAQIREASASMTPRTTILEDRVVNSTSLPVLIYLPQNYALSSVTRQAPGNPLCLALMWGSGVGPGKVQTSRANTKMLSTNSGTTDWSVDSNQSLAVVLTGVATRAGSRTNCTTHYLLNTNLSLGAGTGPTMQTTALTLNHPEILAGLWELKFDRDPTQMDGNGDAIRDWGVAPAAAFDISQLNTATGVWTASPDTLTTQPDTNFTGVTIVDLRMEATTAGASATFIINCVRPDDFGASIRAALKLETDGTQTLTIANKINTTTYANMITFAQLRAAATDLHLIIDPNTVGVSVSINGVQKGTFAYTQLSLPGATKSASISASGGTAKFSYARVRVLKDMP